MKTKAFNRFCLFAFLAVLLACFYPLYMGVRVIWDMVADGSVLKENYPKYIIPYTPIALAVLTGVVLMPFWIRRTKQLCLLHGSVVSTAVFFIAELLFENKVVVQTPETVVVLEDWQMFMCYQMPSTETMTVYKSKTAVELLMGEYNPAFKLHFYVISLVLILVLLNCLYGFGQLLYTANTKRLKALVIQSVCSACFLGLCILACFTAFWRDGSIWVSPLSAFLMSAFFVLLGMTAGLYAGSFLLGKRRLPAVAVPAVVAACMTLLMYIGEMILLNGHLYRLGPGVFFGPIPGIVLSGFDLTVIVATGLLTALISFLLNRTSGPRIVGEKN